MNRFLTLTVAAWLAVLDAAPAAESAAPLVVENQALRLEIQRTPAPFVERLVHKASGQAVIAGPASKSLSENRHSHVGRPSETELPTGSRTGSKSLFTLVIEKEDGSQQTIDSAAAGRSTAELLDSPAGKKAVLRYEQFPGQDLSAEVTVLCQDSDPLTLWSITVENRRGRRLATVRFPQVTAVPAIGQADDDCLVLPALPGALMQNPAANWRNGQSVRLAYPGNLSAQFMTYQDRTAGVYLASMDSAGHPLSLAVAKQAEGFRLWHEFTPVIEAARPSAAPSVRWESPYPVALGVTQGTWCDSADQYKRWAVRQPWCARRLADRDDIPAWWKAGPAVHVCEVRTYDNQRTCNGSFYPKLVEHMRALRAKIDGPVVAMLAGWENHRRWTAGEYFPIFDAEDARRVIGQLRDEGFRPFFYLSGLCYTYENEGRDGGQIPSASQYQDAYAVDRKTGQPRPFTLNESNPSGQWKRHSYSFCPSVPQAGEFFNSVVDQAHALGVDVLQMDQTVSGAGPECWSTHHGHAPGVGLYQSRAFWDLLDAMRRRGKKLSPEFILLHEEPHEQLLQHLDGFHVREYKEKFWYRGYPGAVGIPLFSYLYHEYAIGYGGDSAGVSKDNNRANVRAHAVNLVTGRTPGCAVWSAPQNVADAHPDQIAMLRNHSRLLKTPAQKFLMLGRMLHPYELDVPSLAIPIVAKQGGTWKRETLPTPAVLTSSWQSPDGAIGHLFVNVAEDAQALRVRLDSRNTPAAGSYDADVYRSTQGESFKPLWSHRPLAQDYAAELAPLELLFIRLRVHGS